MLNPRRHPPVLSPDRARHGRTSTSRSATRMPDATDVICDDLVVMHLQYSTQWDTLAHVGSCSMPTATARPEALYYNGFKAGERRGRAGRRRRGRARRPRRTDLVAGAAARRRPHGRGLHAGPRRDDRPLTHHVGRERVVVGYDGLMRVIEADKVAVEDGDMVCLHTGFGASCSKMDGTPDPARVNNACAVLDGRDQRLLQWITDTGLACLIADNYAVEALPGARPGEGCCAAAAARALPVPPRRQSRRALVPDASPTGCARTDAPLPADRAAAAPARRGRLAGDAGRDGLRRSIFTAGPGLLSLQGTLGRKK